MSNQLQRVVESSKWLPANVRATVVSKILGKVVPYVGTSGLLSVFVISIKYKTTLKMTMQQQWR